MSPLRRALYACGFGTTVPSDNVASFLTPRSTPTDGLPRTGAGTPPGLSTESEAYHRPALREIVMRVTFASPTRRATSSKQWTRPTRGSLSALGSPSIGPKEPVVYE